MTEVALRMAVLASAFTGISIILRCFSMISTWIASLLPSIALTDLGIIVRPRLTDAATSRLSLLIFLAPSLGFLLNEIPPSQPLDHATGDGLHFLHYELDVLPVVMVFERMVDEEDRVLE